MKRLALLMTAALALAAAESPEQAVRRQIENLEASGRGESLEAADALQRLSHLLRLGSNPGDPEARRVAQRAIEIRERLLGPDHPQVADALITLGSALTVAGEYGNALQAFERALAIREKAFPAVSEEIAESLNALGAPCIYLGDYPRARQANERALAIRRELYGENHPAVAQVLNDLGVLLWRMKDLWTAKSYLERALAVREKTLAPEDPLIAASLNNLAMVEHALGELAPARALYERALAIREKSLGPEHPRLANGIDNLAGVLAEMGERDRALALMRRALGIREKALGGLHPEVTVSWVHIGTTLFLAGRRAEALDAALHAEDLSRRHSIAVIRSTSERAGVLYSGARIKGLDLALSLAARPRGDEETPRVLDCLIRSRALAVDEMLLRRRAVALPEAAGFQEVAAKLPAGAALVSYAHYHHTLAPEGGRTTEPIGPAYLAFVLSGGGRPPVSVWLGKAPVIDDLVTRWRQEIAKEASAPGLAPLRNERSSRQAGLALRRAAWDPVAAHLGGARRIWLVPDGALSLINFAALPAGQGYLAESGPLIDYLDAERDVLRPAPSKPGAGLLAIGGLAYSVAVNGRRLEPLPASAGEVRDVTAAWKHIGQSPPIEILEGADGTASAFKQRAPGRRALHLATHGVFAQDVPDELVGRDVIPAMRAALALAGNDREGFLTAEEASAMNLEGVEWAVLSGCNTGLGEMSPGEGLLGLRRAFQLAGVGSVVSSLWPVEDEAARRWMSAFYRARLPGRLSTPESVRKACVDVLRARRASQQSTHPFYWGAFVAFGPPR